VKCRWEAGAERWETKSSFPVVRKHCLAIVCLIRAKEITLGNLPMAAKEIFPPAGNFVEGCLSGDLVTAPV
jgi:hypothetical protein